jgi:hypothetical protein
MRVFKKLSINRSFWALVNEGVRDGYIRFEGKHPVIQPAFRLECQEVVGLIMNDRRSLRLLSALGRKIDVDWFSGQDMGSLQEVMSEYYEAVFPAKSSTSFGVSLAKCIEKCAGNEISKRVIVSLAILAAVEDLSALLVA